MWLDNIKDWTQQKGREDEEGLERCGWTTSKTGHNRREEKTRKTWKDVAGQHQRLDTIEGKRRLGRPGKMWLDNIKDWTQ